MDSSEIISALLKHKNVLLYGPPGTGKTKLVSDTIDFLRNSPQSEGQPIINFGDNESKFGIVSGNDVNSAFPKDFDIQWITFHQSYSYEEFIVGKKPVPMNGGIILKPYLGLLMSIAVKLAEKEGSKACLLIIDEINRANASQVFGEFITLLDPEYRTTINGKTNSKALQIRLPGISYDNGLSEDLQLLIAKEPVQIPDDWTFPEHLYILATMNSVDKAALPLDSALTRRFYRIEISPSIELLSNSLEVSLSALEAKAKEIYAGNIHLDSLTAEETTVLILDKLNVHISADMGEDFELGHALVWEVVSAQPENRWKALISVWDHLLVPQLKERYAGRTDIFNEILNIEEGNASSKVFTHRAQIGKNIEENASITIRQLSKCPLEDAISALRTIAT